MKKTIQVFPNSGHQLLFFPLGDGKTAWPKHDEWRSPKDKPWLKGRFGVQAQKSKTGETVEQAGFWVGIDVNVGGPDRGYEVPKFEADAPARRKTSGKIIIDDTDGTSSKAGCHSPYLTSNADDLPGNMELNLNQEFALPASCPALQLDLSFVEEAGAPIPVNLIVDFGNSRTIVLGLEQTDAGDSLSSVCKPILFPKAGLESAAANDEPAELDEAIPESWFVLMEGLFKPEPTHKLSAGFKPSFEKRTLLDRIFNIGRRRRSETVTIAPHLFTRVSPAVMGLAAHDALADLDTEAGGLSFLSSPKRYVWDEQPLGEKGHTHWTMQRQPWRDTSSDAHELVPLKGDIFRFMPNAKADWALNSWGDFSRLDQDIRPDQSRADSLIWVALSILEQAERQIQSEAWRDGNKPYLRRVLGDVILTYPAGWTQDEVNRYRSKWERARDIFVLSRRAEEDGPIPQVRLPIDEAVASQLAIVYAEMHHMRDYGENWIELYGRGTGKDARIRVMTIDIGGGTTDTSVVEYQDSLPGAGMDILSRLIFKDSTTHAGDRLIKDVIEKALLPLIGKDFFGDLEQREAFEEVFFKSAKRDSHRAQWSVITRTVLVPIAQRWLKEMSSTEEDTLETTPHQAGASASQIKRMNALVRAAGIKGDILTPDLALPLERGRLKTIIQHWFSELAKVHGEFAGLFDCDVVILTGKPSELTDVRDLIERHLPVSSDRIISAKNYFAGDWLPMSKTGYIDDAKLVTALGSAALNGIQSGLLTGWNIRTEVDPDYRRENHWGRIAGTLKPFVESDIILPAGEMTASARLLTGSVIGRARFLNHVLPEQVYKLTHVSGRQMLIDAKFRRMVSKPGKDGDHSMTGENLVLVKAKDAHTDKKIPLGELQLQLCTLPQSEDYWQETGRFEVRWAS
ncbi:MAG: virulence factor SrfB [Henriciella sp.]|uniref:virulence factor SrfB n=1 Tax=Henriciella sp. TaxID=1968823 RepID=UPI003C755C73